MAALVQATDGTISAQYEYGPFGEVIRATGPMAKANPFRFSTKYQDDETDLLYYRYPVLQREHGKVAEPGSHRRTGGRESLLHGRE